MAAETSKPDPAMVGGVPKPPFVLRPDASQLFARRAARFAGLASTSPLGPYLEFLARLSDAQAALATDPDLAPTPLDPAAVALARTHAMPPLDRPSLAAQPALRATLDRFFAAVEAVPKPAAAAEALGAVRQVGSGLPNPRLEAMLAGAVPIEGLAEYLFVAAGVQIHAARLAATLDAAALVPVGIGLCPACGALPVASLVVGVMGAEGARYAVCWFCGTAWNEVRIKCLACGSTKGIGYREVDEGSDAVTVKAEVCGSCHAWIKILYQNKNPSLDAVADDVASLGLDVLMRETDYRHAGFNPLLLGY